MFLFCLVSFFFCFTVGRGSHGGYHGGFTVVGGGGFFTAVWGILEFSVLYVVAQRPRFRPNKGFAHNLALGSDPVCEY